MRVGQIKSVAKKIYDEIEFIQTNEKAHYYNSMEFVRELVEFKKTNETFKAFKAAQDWLLAVELPNIDHVAVKVESRYRYSNTESIYRDTNLDDLALAYMESRIKFEYSYNLPASVDDVYAMLEYESITSQNLLEIEEKVKQKYVNASGFKANTAIK